MKNPAIEREQWKVCFPIAECEQDGRSQFAAA